MNNFDKKYTDLKAKTELILDLAEKGNNWLEKNSENGSKKGKQTILNENQRSLKRVLNASQKRPSIAIFGQSQVGKSFLVRGLAKSPKTNKLEILNSITNERIDFIQDVNPPGGRESTGIITRFSKSAPDKVSEEFPFSVELLSQLDIALIIINGYTEDLKDYEEDINKEELIDEVVALKDSLNISTATNISIDDVYDFNDFLLTNYKDEHRIRECKDLNFFKDLSTVLPYIKYNERWKLLQFLWGKNEFLTKLFNELSETLNVLNFSKNVFVNNEAIINNSELGMNFSNSTNILDVERVKEMYKEKQLPVLLVQNDLGKSSKVSRSIFCALIKELHFEIPHDIDSKNERNFLNYTDILDFPGSKSRERVPELVFNSNSANEKLSLFIRGKVSYLFYLYNRDIGISTLLYCMDNEPPLVAESPGLLDKWIKRYVGDSAKNRKIHQEEVLKLLNAENVKVEVENISPLLIAMTKFNIELSGKGDAEKIGDLSSHEAKWFARFQENFSNYMSKSVLDKWTENWNAEDDAFKFIFPNRDPNFSQSIFDGYQLNKKEGTLRPENEPRIADMQKSFLNSKIVDKFIFEKEELWNELLTPNKTGIDYLCKYLAPSSHPANMIAQLNSILNKALHNILEVLKGEHKSGNMHEDLKIANKKSATAFMAIMSLSNHSNKPLSKYFNAMVISELEIWRLLYEFKFYIPEEVENGINLSELKLFLAENGIGIDEPLNIPQISNDLTSFFGISELDLEELLKDQLGYGLNDIMHSKTKIKSPSEHFAEIVMNYWSDKLTSITLVNEKIKTKNNDAMNTIFFEIVKSLTHSKIKNQIVEIIDNEMKGGVSKNQFNFLASCISSILNRFTFSGTWAFVEESSKPLKPKTEEPIFSNNSTLLDERIIQTENLNNTWKNYLKDFSIGIKELYKENVKKEYGFGNDFDSESNQKLGLIINEIERIY